MPAIRKRPRTIVSDGAASHFHLRRCYWPTRYANADLAPRLKQRPVDQQPSESLVPRSRPIGFVVKLVTKRTVKEVVLETIKRGLIYNMAVTVHIDTVHIHNLVKESSVFII